MSDIYRNKYIPLFIPDSFIDGNKVWKVNRLIKLASELPIFNFDVSTISLDEVLKWRLINIRDIINHINRINSANLINPIILRSNGYIMDGWHRVVKSKIEGRNYLPAKQFTIDPKPDYIL